MVHQKKGGIHESNRIFMGTFGWYRLTGLLHQNICDAKKASVATRYTRWPFFFSIHFFVLLSHKLTY